MSDGKPPTLILDLDRTLCWYLQKDEGDPPRYEEAHPLPGIADRVRHERLTYRVIIWTGRNSGLRELTEKQLKTWGIEYDELRMDKPKYAKWVDDLAVNAAEWLAERIPL